MAEATWDDNRKKMADLDYRSLWKQLEKQQQGLNISVTVPHFKHGKLILQLSFIDELGRSSRFFTESRCAKSYQDTSPAQVKDKPPGTSPRPITHSWGIGVADIPKDAAQADIRLWFDPYGDAKSLLPSTGGLLLISYKGSKTHVQSI